MSNEEEETLLRNSNQPENSNTFNIAEKEPLEYIPFDSFHNSTSKEQTGSDKLAYALLGLLFCIESLPLGLFGASIPLILVANGSDFMDLAEFSVVALPYILKVFLAPVFDSTQPHPYGKRKTFLIPNLLFGGAIQILISFWIQGIVDNANIHIITFVGFLISLISAIIDIIANGWVVSLVSQKNLAHVPTVHKVASSLGIFLSFNAFIPLNSVDFCNKYIYSEPRGTPVFTLSGFALGSGMCFVVATIFLHFFNEPDFPEEHHATFHDIKEALKLFWRNPKLKLLALSALLSGFGINPVLAIFIPNMIQQGIPKEIVANLSTFLLPLAILCTVIIGFINKKHKQEFTVMAVGYIIGAITVVIPIYAMLYLQVQTQYNESLYLLIALSALVIVVMAIKMIPWQSFSYRIAHESMATTFLVILFSLRLLGIYWPSLIALLIGDYVNLTLIAIVSTGLSIVYLVWFWKKVRPLQDLATRDFGFYKETQVLV